MATNGDGTGVDDYGLREACGLFGCVANARGGVPSELDVSHTIHMGLVGVQHRGQESAGIVTSSGKPNAPFCVKKSMGLVNNSFVEDDLQKLKGNIGIGHTRYSTQGDSDHINIQPFIVETLQGRIAVAHNGELVNAKSLRRRWLNKENSKPTIVDTGDQLSKRTEKQLLLHGVGLSTGSDSEILTQLLTHPPASGEPNGADWLARIQKVMSEAVISYSLLIMLSDRVYAIRDPFGNRPLCLGKLLPSSAFGKHPVKKEYGDNELDGWVVSSESCAFNATGAIYHREVLPGEVVEITCQGFKSRLIVERPKDKLPAFCFFEYVYFARPDSVFEGQMVYTVRKRCGEQLAKEAPVEADIVSTVPDSATPAAIEYAHRLGIPFENVLCKNTYVGRTFIQPTTRLRQLGVAKKFGPLFENLDGKRIVLIDDSIVRGNTMGSIVRLLKRSGAKEVHIRIASPPIKYPCFMGINIPTREELIANVKSVDEIREHVGADTLHYLSIEGLLQAVEEGVDKTKPYGHCVACLTGEYPVTPEW